MCECETQNSPFNWILAAFKCLWICHFDSPQGGGRSEEPIDVILTNDSEKVANESESTKSSFSNAKSLNFPAKNRLYILNFGAKIQIVLEKITQF